MAMWHLVGLATSVNKQELRKVLLPRFRRYFAIFTNFLSIIVLGWSILAHLSSCLRTNLFASSGNYSIPL